jgi:xanthine dehydrogenase small subunit
MTTQSIRFYHLGAIREAAGLPASRTVLQHLREDLHCTGTKEGCAEGDCGACTVVVGELDARGGVALRAVNSCIQFLPTLDGRALFTVESLRGPGRELHPVQQALVDCHGSQCGFCTPGFVMSLWALYEMRDPEAGPPSRDEIDAALSGNLCRCTGYRPIVDAALKMFDARLYPRPPSAAERAAAALRALVRESALHYAPATAYAARDARGARDARDASSAESGTRAFYAPTSLAEFATLRAQHPEARILAGSTDVGLWVTKQFRELGDILYIGNVAELKTIESDSEALTIGAAASLEDAFEALVALYPALSEMWARFASRPIRNAGTLGGNVANGSPIGDSMPPLIALGSDIVLQAGDTVRLMPLEAFYVAYQKTALQPGEFVRAIRVPRPAAGLRGAQAVRFRAYKLAKRYDQDISAVCAAFAVRLSDSTPPVVEEARIAFGGMAATPRRASRAEAALRGAPWHETSVRIAMESLGDDYQPLSDMRASSTYRLRAARNLLLRFYLETRDEAPLSTAEVRAFGPAARRAAQAASQPAASSVE